MSAITIWTKPTKAKPGELSAVPVAPISSTITSRLGRQSTDRITNAGMRGIYDGKELGRNPGIPAGRFAAYELPSMTSAGRIMPKGAS